MTTVEFAGDMLVVRFTAVERAVGRVHALEIPVTAITHAEHLTSWRAACQGTGWLIGVDDIWAIGVRTHQGARRLISLRSRRGRALRITMTGQRFDELILSVPRSHLILHALADGRWADHSTDPSWAVRDREAVPSPSAASAASAASASPPALGARPRPERTLTP